MYTTFVQAIDTDDTNVLSTQCCETVVVYNRVSRPTSVLGRARNVSNGRCILRTR